MGVSQLRLFPKDLQARTSDTMDLKSRTNLSRETTLGSAEDDVKKFLARWHRLDLEKGRPC
jgi:hypothetical protein